MSLDPVNRPVEDSVIIDDAAPVASPQVRKQALVSALEAEREHELADLSAVLSTDAGRAVILRLLKLCQPYRTTVLSTDVEQYLMAEGRRGVAHWLITEMGAIAPDVYPNLLLHNAKSARARADYAAGVESASRRRA